MASRLGVPERILDRARALAGPDDVRLEKLLEQVEEDSRRLASERRLLEQELSAARQERSRAEEERRASADEVRHIKEKARTEAREVLSGLRQKLRELSRSPALDRADIKRVGEEAEALGSRLVSKAATERTGKAVHRRDFRSGETVRIERLNKTGTVLASHGEMLELEVGAKKIKLPAEEVVPVDAPSQTRLSVRTPGWSAELQEEEGAADRLNIIGLRVPEGLAEVDRFIDRAGLHHLTIVTVIHGVGTGALKTAVTEFLKNHPLIGSIRPGEPAEGGAGVTVAELKK
jgi:DNA mismatch repair protein MutS2